MKTMIWTALIAMMAISCKKTCYEPEPPVQPQPQHPSMSVKDLGDSSIAFGKFASFDLDNNGEKDVYFSTQLVGDPVEQKDKRQWMVTSSFNSNLAVNSGEQIPFFHYTDSIPVRNFSGYQWFNASHILLAQKTIGMTNTWWEGDWRQASHNFVSIQLIKADGLYNGWVEVSFSTANEKLTLHRIAVCKEVNRSIVAGKI